MFYGALELKNALQGYKKKKINNFEKLRLFSNGFLHSFAPKLAFFPSYYNFSNYRPGKCVFRCPRTKKQLSRL